jgi:UDP-N-acetylmuramoylalanine--D-glutamate ligase
MGRTKGCCPVLDCFNYFGAYGSCHFKTAINLLEMKTIKQHLAEFVSNPAAYKVLVVGGGISGFAVLQFLKQKGVDVSLSDSGLKKDASSALLEWLERENVFSEFGGHQNETFLGADLIVVSPGVSLDIPQISECIGRGIPIAGEMGLASCFINIPVVAVTGTNGKTTVTEMLGTMFRADGQKVFVGGNIGTPLTDFLIEGQDAELAVLEVSSFQLETAGIFQPKVAVILNITPDHLDRYESFEAYGDTKFKLLENQQQADAMVLNCDDPEIMERAENKKSPGEKYFFCNTLSGSQGAEWKNKCVELCWTGKKEKEQYPLSAQMRLSPVKENCMAAVLAARLMGCSEEGVRRGLEKFQILPHRVSLIEKINNVSYYDDSKATNIGAVQSALAGMNQPVILIAGGRDKGGDYSLLSEAVRKKVKRLLLIGEAREKMKKVLGEIVQVEMPQGIEAAVRRAAELAEPGDAVLLSPACASFDMFRSYVDRGEHFQKAVRQLLEN